MLFRSADINVTFPKEYGNDELAGKPAVFTVTVKEIHRKLPVTVDEELAKKMGFEELASLRKVVGEQIGKEFARAARSRVKRQLLDQLADRHSFAVPPGMVDIEFDNIWKSVEEARKRGDDDPTIKGKSDEQLKADFKGISERRVRLGLLLSEIGRAHV